MLPATVLLLVLLLAQRRAAFAAVCASTGKEPPSVTTLMASPDDLTYVSWVVRPNCGRDVITAEDPTRSPLIFVNQGIEYVESVPRAVEELILQGNPLSRGANLRSTADLFGLKLSGFSSTTMANLQLPDSLRSLDVSGNQLTSLQDVALPGNLVELILSDNRISAFDRVALPASLRVLTCAACGTSAWRGTRVPESLKSLSFEGSTVTTFEIRQSDLPIIQDLNGIDGQIRQPTCDGGDVTVVSIRDSTGAFVSHQLCVISDKRFTELYGAPAANPAPSPGPSSETTSSTSPSAIIATTNTTYAANETSGSLPKSSTSGSLGSIGSGADESSGSSSSSSPTTNTVSSIANKTTASGSQSSSDTTSSGGTTKRGSGSKVTATTPSSTGSKSTILVVAATAGAVFAMVVAFFVYRAVVKRREDADDSTDGKPMDSLDTSTDAFLANDIRNDPALILHRIELDQVILTERIVGGTAGAIYHGVCQGRDVAVKKLLLDAWHDERVVTQFMDQIRLCATLEHPKIVVFLGFAGHRLRDLSLISEFMAGGDLLAMLQKHRSTSAAAAWNTAWAAGRLMIKSKLSIAQDVAEAAVYLHSFQTPLVHRNISARSVVLDSVGNAKLSGFSIGRQVAIEETMTGTFGSVAWMAPEVLRGDRYDERADIYSLGVLLVEMDRECHPFANHLSMTRESSGRTVLANFDVARLVSVGQLQPIVSSNCPEKIASLVATCVSFDADSRPTAMGVAHAIRQIRKAYQSTDIERS